jgi:hypothetical protein
VWSVTAMMLILINLLASMGIQGEKESLNTEDPTKILGTIYLRQHILSMDHQMEGLK